jgi:hypothetical protein
VGLRVHLDLVATVGAPVGTRRDVTTCRNRVRHGLSSLQECGYFDFTLDLVLVLVVRDFDRELGAVRERRRVVWVFLFATAPVGSLGNPAASRSFFAISAISSGS